MWKHSKNSFFLCPVEEGGGRIARGIYTHTHTHTHIYTHARSPFALRVESKYSSSGKNLPRGCIPREEYIYIFSLSCKRLRLYLHEARGKRGLNMFFRPSSSLYANNGPRYSSIPLRVDCKASSYFLRIGNKIRNGWFKKKYFRISMEKYFKLEKYCFNFTFF